MDDTGTAEPLPAAQSTQLQSGRERLAPRRVGIAPALAVAMALCTFHARLPRHLDTLHGVHASTCITSKPTPKPTHYLQVFSQTCVTSEPYSQTTRRPRSTAGARWALGGQGPVQHTLVGGTTAPAAAGWRFAGMAAGVCGRRGRPNQPQPSWDRAALQN